jgi:hypothetical protein
MAIRVGVEHLLRVAGAGIVAVALSGCVDSGLPGKNLPLEQARTKPFRYSVYDAASDLPAAEVAGRTWRPAGPPEPVPASLLVPVESMGAHDVFSLSTDPAPHSRLYVRTGTLYTPYARVDGGHAGAAPAETTRH